MHNDRTMQGICRDVVRCAAIVQLLLSLDADRVCAFQPIVPSARNHARRCNDSRHRQSQTEQNVEAIETSFLKSSLMASVDLDGVGHRAMSSEPFSSIATALDPSDAQARLICRDVVHLTDEQYEKVCQLASFVCGWNEKLNLVSRKDCNEATVFARHILPCLAMYDAGLGNVDTTSKPGSNSAESPEAIPSAPSDAAAVSAESMHLFLPNCRVMDVGTGGGFPGLPLAIQYPSVQFVLADSVGKKIAAVADMAATLQLSNVRTYNGRVEEYFAAQTSNDGGDTVRRPVRDMDKFDIVTGRSVTALPQFCAWIQGLLKPKTGHLVYWIGGDIDPSIQQLALIHANIQDRIPGWVDDSDKKVLVFTAASVRQIASASGIKVVPSKSSASIRKSRTSLSKSSTGAASSGKKLAKGAWKKKDDGPRQRGLDNFQRYSSTTGTRDGSVNGNGVDANA